MGECICSSCKNLKAVIAEDEAPVEFTCEYGFPSPKCEACEEEECSESCSHYAADDEEGEAVTVKCCKCGREMTQSAGSSEVGDVYCIDCYFKAR